MKKGINYIRINLSVYQDTVDMLAELADLGFVNTSAVVRRAIKELHEKLMKQHGGNA